MNAKSSRAKIVLVSALGTALVLPLFLTPASAGLDGGHFFIHAQDLDAPKPHEATAGLGGLKGGGSTGGDSTAALATYTAGPLSLKITQAMVDFSKANVKAQEEGRTGDIKTDPDGWKTLWFTDSDGNYTQTPSSASADTTVFLSKRTTAPDWWEGAPGDMDNSDTVAFYDKRGSSVEAGTKIGPSSAGTTFYYKKVNGGSGGSSLKEGRYISEDGTTIAATVETMGSGFNVTRTVSAGNRMPAPSDTKPYKFESQSGAVREIEVFPKTGAQGYNYITMSDGSVLRYMKLTDESGRLQSDYDAQDPRKDGPVYLSVTPSGRFDSFSYFDSSGERQSGGDGESTYSVADYNQITGQNWDGKYPKPSDFDFSKPFEPKG